MAEERKTGGMDKRQSLAEGKTVAERRKTGRKRKDSGRMKER